MCVVVDRTTSVPSRGWRQRVRVSWSVASVMGGFSMILIDCATKFRYGKLEELTSYALGVAQL